MLDGRRTPRTRSLGTAHFAFMRALVQGLPLRESWERYLQVEGSASDLRVVRSTIQWIRDAFAAAAKREDRHGTARLVRMDVSRLGDPTPQLPSLEEFAASQGLEDFSQAEQIEAYEQAYGRASQRLRRQARLIRRQLDALRWLEERVAEPPRAGDSVSAWLNPAIADRLEAAGVFTLAQLVERINGLGFRWYAGVRGLGVTKAERIAHWLRAHESDHGLIIGRHVELPRARLFSHELAAVVPAATEIRPLEKFLIPSDLDGSAGLYRRPQAQCTLRATNDYLAILAWLRAKHGLSPQERARMDANRRRRDPGQVGELAWLESLSHTQRAYRKEAERFLLWTIVQQGKPLSSMTHEDCVAYREFLADPQPRSRWCGPRSRERWSPLWRPFEGPLSPAAQRQAITVLRNLYAYLVDHNYLMGNPWSGVAVPRDAGPRINTGRSLTAAQWAMVQTKLQELPATSANQRLRFALPFLYATGLRLSEAVAATVDDLQWVEYPADAQDGEPIHGWLLRVIGKGNKLREVPVPIDVVADLSRYLVARGLDADPQDFGNQGACLLGQSADASELPFAAAGQGGRPADPRRGITTSTLYRQVKQFFARCADDLRRQGDHKGAMKLDAASTHWLRHSHASHAVAQGMPIEMVQQNLGHASLATTTVYVETEKKRRLRAADRFWTATRA